MTKPANMATLTTLWEIHAAETRAALTAAFTEHAERGPVDGAAFSAQAETVAEQIWQLMRHYFHQPDDDPLGIETIDTMAEQGLTMTTAAAMMRSLQQVAWLNEGIDDRQTAVFLQTLLPFQTHFLEKLATARERLLNATPENTPESRHPAGELHWSQEKQNRSLSEILALNARLATADSEAVLLETAVRGICQAMELVDVTLLAWSDDHQRWQLRHTTASYIQADRPIPAEWLDYLSQARQHGEFREYHTTNDGSNATAVTTTLILNSGGRTFGGMVITSSPQTRETADEQFILLRTFAQGLAALWNNLHLLRETTQRTRELEILQGRHIDALWQDPNASLSATYTPNKMDVQRIPAESVSPTTETPTLPLQIGPLSFGQVTFPQLDTLSSEQQEFVEALVREMGSAINNAHLLQTTRTVSNQLSLATEVSRAATTMLDRDLLIQEVTTLIQERFNLYYVGLFLVDEDRQVAVLKAGTGEAGKEQLARGHTLRIGPGSMIGTAVSAGRARVEQDVTKAESFTFNPLLPKTRSELALPLRSRGSVIGALTVQSTEVGTFSTETVRVLQSLADQLAIAIENADLFAQTQNTLAKTSHLFQISRRMSEARSAEEVYAALVDFARLHGGFDAAQVLIEDPLDPRYYISTANWRAKKRRKDPAPKRLPGHQLPFSERLMANESVVLQPQQTNLPDVDFVHQAFQDYGVDAIALIPIYSEGEWLSTLVLYSRYNDATAEQELQSFRTLANQAAIILTNQQLLHQTETLYRIGRTLSEALTREDALELTVKEVATYLGAPQCRIILYDHQHGYGTVAAEYIPTPEVASLRLDIDGDYLYDTLNHQRQPLVLRRSDADIPEEALARHVQPFDAEATLFIPAASQQEFMGYLAIDSQTGIRPFNQNAIIFAQTVIDHLTTQIENIKLLDEALNRAQELITLNQIQANISGILELRRLATTIHHQVGRLLDNTTFILARYNHESQVYTPVLVVNEGRPFPFHPRKLTTNDPIFTFLQKGRPLRVDGSHPLMKSTEITFESSPMPAGLWVPILRDDTPIGLISVQSYEPNIYSENDIQLLRSIATHTSLAMANADLFTQIQANIEEIQSANEKLRQLDQMKTQFLANMSHELRTPLNSIIGFSRVILKGIDGPITTEQEEDLTSIYQNGQHLLRLINDILEMAKIEAGKMTLTFEPINVEEEAATIISATRSLIGEKVRFMSEIAPNLPIIEADPLRVRQILMNLVSNAAKFTEAGYILVRIVAPTREMVHIMVEDTGIGIDSKDYDKLFTAFEQVNTSNTRTVSGTGLGLPITQWLVNMHHGRIWFESKVGIGTTFHVVLPVAQPRDSLAEPTQQTEQEN